jgi:molybdopterin converting factor small subunit
MTRHHSLTHAHTQAHAHALPFFVSVSDLAGEQLYVERSHFARPRPLTILHTRPIPSLSLTSSKMKLITVLYFASIRTHLGIEQESFPAPSTLSKVKAEIVSRHPDEKTKSILEGCMWSVGDEMADEDEDGDKEIKGGVVVAVIPPVSGG